MKIRKSDIIIWLVILLNIIFTIVVLYIFYKVKTEPVVLIGAWFSFTTVEVWQLASIKKHKLKGENRNAEKNCN